MLGRWPDRGPWCWRRAGARRVLQALSALAPLPLFIAEAGQLLLHALYTSFTEAGGGAGKVFKSIHPSTLGTFWPMWSQ